MTDQNPPRDPNNEDDELSVKGKGWDILVGGKNNVEAAGGDDPFDLDNPHVIEMTPLAEKGLDAHVAAEDLGEVEGFFSPAPPALMTEEAQPGIMEITPLAERASDELPPVEAEDLGETEGVFSPAPPDLMVEETKPGVIEIKALADRGEEAESLANADDLGETDGFFSPAPPDLITSEGLPDLTPEQLGGMDAPPEGVILAGIEEDTNAEGETEPPLVNMEEITTEPTVPSDMPADDDKVANMFDELSRASTAGKKADLAGAGSDDPPQRVTSMNLPNAIDVVGPRGIISSDRGVPVARSRREVDADKLTIDEELSNMLITKEKIKELWEEIDKLYEIVVDDVRGDYKFTEQSLSDLQFARELLLAGRDYYDEAEEIVMSVRARLRLEHKVQEWSRTRGSFIAVYLVIWLVSLSAFSLAIASIEEIIMTQFGVSDFLLGTILPGMFGGLGGVVGAIWVLIKHTARERNFDPLHQVWFLLNPFMGVALGVLTYILSYGGGLLFSVGTSTTFDPSESVAVYGICAIVGFRQNVFWKLIERVAGGLFSDEEDEEDSRTNSSDFLS